MWDAKSFKKVGKNPTEGNKRIKQDGEVNPVGMKFLDK